MALDTCTQAGIQHLDLNGVMQSMHSSLFGMTCFCMHEFMRMRAAPAYILAQCCKGHAFHLNFGSLYGNQLQDLWHLVDVGEVPRDDTRQVDVLHTCPGTRTPTLVPGLQQEPSSASLQDLAMHNLGHHVETLSHRLWQHKQVHILSSTLTCARAPL